MDWIEEQWENIKKQIQNLSLRKALIVYISTAVLAIILCFLLMVSILDGWDRLLDSRYTNQGKMETVRLFNSESQSFTIQYEAPETWEYQIIRFIKNWSVLFHSIIGIVVTSVLFYNQKLKMPMELLRKEAAHIGKGELNYVCTYQTGDEMGELCGLFDEMRVGLGEDYKNMWDLMEDQRRLNAAFAHDLRTPLTVLRGYTDYLSRYYPEGKVTEEQLCDNLRVMNQQVLRLMNFSNTMKEIHTLESLEVKRGIVLSSELEQNIRDTIQIMDGTNGIHMRYTSSIWGEKSWYLDQQVVMEVMENAVSNGLRYAKGSMEVALGENEDGTKLILYVQDDGSGFTREGLKMASNPYYHDKKEKEENHFGIGLFICGILCKKHGGELELSNSISGGAIISATFSVR